MTVNSTELEPEVILQRIIHSLEASIPGLSLRGVVGEPRPGSELFPDHDGDPSPHIDPSLMFRERGVTMSYDGDGSMGYRGSVSSDLSIDRWADFAVLRLEDIQDMFVHDSGEAWPRTPGQPGLVSPHAVVENGVLHMWFGERTNPVLSFAPVVLVSRAT